LFGYKIHVRNFLGRILIVSLYVGVENYVKVNFRHLGMGQLHDINKDFFK